jgi:hypothetical protein
MLDTKILSGTKEETINEGKGTHFDKNDQKRKLEFTKNCCVFEEFQIWDHCYFNFYKLLVLLDTECFLDILF